jgi:FMN reductase
MGADTVLFDGAFVARQPLYVPECPTRSAEESEFVDTVRRCHGLIVATPGYHGSLSGPIKNILDVLEETARDPTPYLDGRSFGCIVVAHGWQACGTTLVTLRSIAHGLRAWPTPFGATFNASAPLFRADGTCIEDKTQQQLALVASQVVDFARYRHAWQSAGAGESGRPDLQR